MQCPVCGGLEFALDVNGVEDFEYQSPGTYSYMACRGCGVLAIDPMPSPEVLSIAYPADYHAYADPRNALGRYLKRSYWRDKARRYAKLSPEPGPVLDLGCAHGAFLREMKGQGFVDLTGLDTNERAIEAVRSQGMQGVVADLEDADLPVGHFSIIAMTNYIEHVFDPVACLRICHRLLKPGGWIVGETPNTACWDRSLFGRHWGGYHAPRHVYLFDVYNIRALAQEASFFDCQVRNLMQPAHWALSVQNILQDGGCLHTLHHGRSAFYTPMLLTFAPINGIQNLFSLGTSMEFFMRKDG